MLAAEWTTSNDHQYRSNEWDNVIWSDETHVEVFNRKNRTLVRRLKSENNEPFNSIPRVQSGGGTASVWRCMSGGARGPLVIYTGKMDGSAYIKTIQDALPMFIENTFDAVNDNWISMQDNAPSHTSKYSMKWSKDNNIRVLK
ncbi:unnamed protein product [Rotaria socialis]